MSRTLASRVAFLLRTNFRIQNAVFSSLVWDDLRVVAKSSSSSWVSCAFFEACSFLRTLTRTSSRACPSSTWAIWSSESDCSCRHRSLKSANVACRGSLDHLITIPGGLRTRIQTAQLRLLLLYKSCYCRYSTQLARHIQERLKTTSYFSNP
jgi:hypothetical protein